MKKRTGIVTDIMGRRGYGFIRASDGQRVFFQARAICDPTFDELREGHTVEFMTVDTPKGTKAIGVRVIGLNPLGAVK